MTRSSLGTTASLRSLLTLDGSAFVREAYRAILGREADESGLQHYTQSVCEGTEKLEILRQLSQSPEGANRGQRIRGLGAALTWARLCRMPLLRMLTARKGAPSTIAIQQTIAHTVPGQSAGEIAADSDIALIAQSGFFSAPYYKSRYVDVATSSVDPLRHYVTYGWKEGRNPSEQFDTRFYLQVHPDVKISKMNPLVHYIKYGIAEKRVKLPAELLDDVSRYQTIFSRRNEPHILPDYPSVDIVVPIYNGLEFLPPLFNSIIQNTYGKYRLIAVDDCSPDPTVRNFLRSFAAENPELQFLLLENTTNLGFVGSVNTVVPHLQSNFVLLNSDTEVPPGWLERLMGPIFEMPNVASTTPFTNAGTICSFPKYLQDNPIFEDLTVKEVDQYFRRIDPEANYLSIPTAVGFCMGVNKAVVEKIGMFDPIFGRGYGEENDWCLRATKLGFRHIHVPNLFVYHKHGGSFESGERRQLIEKNMAILHHRYPNYHRDVQRVIRDNALKSVRDFLIIAISVNQFKTTIVIDNELGGGAHYYRTSYVNDIWRMGRPIIVVSMNGSESKMEFRFRAHHISLNVSDLQDLLIMLGSLPVDSVVVNSLVSFPVVSEWQDFAVRIKAETKCKLVFLLHDYFCICPSYTLLNDKNKFCGVPSDEHVCLKCIQANKGEFKRFERSLDIPRWRLSWRQFLAACDQIVAFSSSSRQIVLKAYPELSERVIDVVPHDISGRLRNVYHSEKRFPSSFRRIGILGGINTAKGSSVVRDLVGMIEKLHLPVNIVVIGELDIDIQSSVIKIIGKYATKDLENIVLREYIDIFFLPSIWPETYSFTTDEVMQLGYPLVVFNIGAPAERVKSYPLGKVIEFEDVYKTLLGPSSNKPLPVYEFMLE